MGRYTLMMETYDNQTVNVCFKESSKMTSKVSLKTIDIFTSDVANQKDLLKEQENIADLKKYNMALQNIKISDDIRKFFINPNNPKK